jgi:hypothetical protein
VSLFWPTPEYFLTRLSPPEIEERIHTTMDPHISLFDFRLSATPYLYAQLGPGRWLIHRGRGKRHSASAHLLLATRPGNALTAVELTAQGPVVFGRVASVWVLAVFSLVQLVVVLGIVAFLDSPGGDHYLVLLLVPVLALVNVLNYMHYNSGRKELRKHLAHLLELEPAQA